MRCLCGNRSYMHHHYPVKGARYGALPGRVRVYRCNECDREVRTLEIRLELLKEHEKHYQEKFQQYIKRNAALTEKINWLKRPVNMKKHKIERIRAKIMELLDLTF